MKFQNITWNCFQAGLVEFNLLLLYFLHMYVDYVIYHPGWNIFESEKGTLLIIRYNSRHKPGLSWVTSKYDHQTTSYLFMLILEARRDHRKKHGRGEKQTNKNKTSSYTQSISYLFLIKYNKLIAY